MTKDIPLIPAKKTPRSNVTLDKSGFFVIEVSSHDIRVEYYKNVYRENKIVSGSLQKVFVGARADALCDTIAMHVSSLRPEHYLYLGRELMCAQLALEKHEPYEQGGC